MTTLWNTRVDSNNPGQSSHLGPILFILFINDLPSTINDSNVLLYADDVKLFLSYKWAEDYNLLQRDLNNMVEWCNHNLMSLNLQKCRKISFSRFSPAVVSYHIQGHCLEEVSYINDLGVFLDSKLRYNLHIESIINKANSLLGFLKRWAKEFNDSYITKHLFTALVRPSLEYACVVWDPSYNCYIDQIESVQKKFLLFALRGLPWDTSIPLPPYLDRLNLIHLPSLRKRRTIASILFLTNLIKGNIDSPYLLNLITFNIPHRTSRYFLPIRLTFCRTNYELHNPFRNACKIFNELYNEFLLTDSNNIIKQKLSRVL